MVREQNKATNRGEMQQNLFQTLKGKTVRKTAKEKIGKPQKILRFNTNTFDSQIKRGTKEEKYKTTVCKQYHVRVHKGLKSFLFLYAAEI